MLSGDFVARGEDQRQKAPLPRAKLAGSAETAVSRPRAESVANKLASARHRETDWKVAARLRPVMKTEEEEFF